MEILLPAKEKNILKLGQASDSRAIRKLESIIDKINHPPEVEDQKRKV